MILFYEKDTRGGIARIINRQKQIKNSCLSKIKRNKILN